MAINLVMSANPEKIRSGDCQQKYQMESVYRRKGNVWLTCAGGLPWKGLTPAKDGDRQRPNISDGV